MNKKKKNEKKKTLFSIHNIFFYFISENEIILFLFNDQILIIKCMGINKCSYILRFSFYPTQSCSAKDLYRKSL